MSEKAIETNLFDFDFAQITPSCSDYSSFLSINSGLLKYLPQEVYVPLFVICFQMIEDLKEDPELFKSFNRYVIESGTESGLLPALFLKAALEYFNIRKVKPQISAKLVIKYVEKLEALKKAYKTLYQFDIVYRAFEDTEKGRAKALQIIKDGGEIPNGVPMTLAPYNSLPPVYNACYKANIGEIYPEIISLKEETNVPNIIIFSLVKKTPIPTDESELFNIAYNLKTQQLSLVMINELQNQIFNKKSGGATPAAGG